MKRIVMLGAVGLCACRAWGQGQVHFSNQAGFSGSNSPGAVLAPVYLAEPGNAALEKHGNAATGIPAGSQTYTGALVPNGSYTAQLWGGPAGSPEDQLRLVASATFKTNGNGIVNWPHPSPTVPGVPAGQWATFQLRVWDNRGGLYATWPQVLMDASALRGKSTLFTAPFPLGGGLTIAPNLQGLESFNLHLGLSKTAPQIATQPRSQTVDPGTNVALSVAAFGTDALAYQWRFNGAILPSGTNWTLFLTNAQVLNAGDYMVVVSNPAGAVTSTVATVSLRSPPVIVAQPLSDAQLVGANTLFAVSAAGLPTLGYQWLRNGNALNNGGRIRGATSASLTIALVQPSDIGVYSVRITNSLGSTTSSGAVLSVLAPRSSNFPPVFTMNSTAGGVFISWSVTTVVFQEADTVNGPWWDLIPQPASPFKIPVGPGSKFYRVRPSLGVANGSVQVLPMLTRGVSNYPPALTWYSTPSGVIMSWLIPGVILQEAPTVIGPWNDVTPPPVSPFKMPVGTGTKFYRVRLP